MRELIFTHANSFGAQFGTTELGNLKTQLSAYQGSRAARGVTADVIFVDDAASLPPGTSPAPANGAQCTDVKQVMDTVASQANPAYDLFLILGGHSVVPFFEYANPVSGDSDPVVYSDNGYAIAGPVAEGQEFYVQRALSRMPTGCDATPQPLYSALDEAASASPPPAGAGGGCCIVAQDWGQLTLPSAQSLGIKQIDYHISPPIDLTANPTNFDPGWLDGRSIHFFNLHGSNLTPDWYGESGSAEPPAYEPGLIGGPQLRVKDAVVGSEACYGADVIGTDTCPRSVATALSLKYLDQGALGFCGSTTICYGGTGDDPTRRCADLLVLYFLQALRGGRSLGSALLLAKSQLATEVKQAYGSLDPQTEKTLLQFVVYGGPGAMAFQGTGSKDITINARLLAAARAGELGTRFHQMRAKRHLETVPGAEARDLVASTVGLPPKIAKRGPRLLSVSVQQLQWDRALHLEVVEQLSKRLGVGAKSFATPPDNATWHTEAYGVESALPGKIEYYVRTIQREPTMKLINEGVSRGGVFARHDLDFELRAKYNSAYEVDRHSPFRKSRCGLQA